MTKVLKCDCGSGDAYVSENVTLPASWYLQVDLAIPTSTLAALQAATDYGTANLIEIGLGGGDEAIALGNFSSSASLNSPTTASVNNEPAGPVFHPSVFPADQLNTVSIYYDGTDIHWSINGVALASYAESIPAGVTLFSFGGAAFSNGVAGELYYVTNVKIGTTLGGSDLFADAFASGDTSAWSPGGAGDVSVIDDPFVGGGGPIPGLTIKIYDLGTTVLADISAIALTKKMVKQAGVATFYVVTAPANHPLLTTLADDGLPNLDEGGDRKLVVWEDADPDTEDPIFHGRIYKPEHTGDANSTQVAITAYDARMELGYEADNRAGRIVRDSSATTVGDPSFLTPEFTSSVPDQDEISGPDLIQQILTYSQGDPTTNPVQGEGPLPIDVISGTWDLDVPPAIDLNPVDSADWPVLVGDLINQLVETDAVDFVLRPIRPGTGLNLDGDPDPYIMVEASAVSKAGDDLTATVHFDYFTGDHNAMAARAETDFSTVCDRLWYELGPRLNKRHWRGDITPHGALHPDLLPLMDDAADQYGGPDTFKGYLASFRIFDSLGTENSSRPLYEALYRAEVLWRLHPRFLLHITPAPGEKALFTPPQDFDVYDLVRITTGPGFGVELDEAQRVYGYTKEWTREGVAKVSELQTSADVA